mmetsp:Transcript_33545/g.79094  ORF Transcript_33545/g.79094 Transcript_33545/m.79094 type:complete len:88 (+) Transcript_33545:1394-1657(+)
MQYFNKNQLAIKCLHLGNDSQEIDRQLLIAVSECYRFVQVLLQVLGYKICCWLHHQPSFGTMEYFLLYLNLPSTVLRISLFSSCVSY